MKAEDLVEKLDYWADRSEAYGDDSGLTDVLCDAADMIEKLSRKVEELEYSTGSMQDWAGKAEAYVVELERRVTTARAEDWNEGLLGYVEAMSENLHSENWMKSDFVSDIRDWASTENPYRSEENWPKEELKKAAEEWRAIPDFQKRHIPIPPRLSEESR